MNAVYLIIGLVFAGSCALISCVLYGTYLAIKDRDIHSGPHGCFKESIIAIYILAFFLAASYAWGYIIVTLLRITPQ